MVEHQRCRPQTQVHAVKRTDSRLHTVCGTHRSRLNTWAAHTAGTQISPAHRSHLNTWAVVGEHRVKECTKVAPACAQEQARTIPGMRVGCSQS
eukprot:1138415-Pelagomonas_calceolata.AAC.9